MTRSNFVDALNETVPEAGPTVREHLKDNFGELILHMLMADLWRLAVAWFERGETEPMTRLLQVVESGLLEGDDEVENAVAVSFVEQAAWWKASSQAFISTWPEGLSEEVTRQRNAGS